MNTNFISGQRWISDSEPELGLGIISAIEGWLVKIDFPAAGSSRQYSVDQAPLTRITFKAGEEVLLENKIKAKVLDVELRDGLSFYQVPSLGWVCESDLSPEFRLTKADKRLLQGLYDEWPMFNLRLEMQRAVAKLEDSGVRGFLGPRVDLIPHQFFIASEVSEREQPRVLLADEVGLGKTIEAAMILHKMLLSGQVTRVLILVPEALAFQWFVEMLRKFNLLFEVMDEKFSGSSPNFSAKENPLNDHQLWIAGTQFFGKNPNWSKPVLDADWDMLIVDEAHHLTWSEQEASPEYLFVEEIAQTTPRLLLLTATPEQLGEESHFARLRLLDPNRFTDFQKYLTEQVTNKKVADLANAILGQESLSKAHLATLKKHLGQFIDVSKLTANLNKNNRTILIQHLLDHYSSAHIMYRNQRHVMKGFPKRIPHLHELKVDDELVQAVNEEIRADFGLIEDVSEYDFSANPRLAWIMQFLLEDTDRKVLILCRTKAKLMALDAALRQRINVGIALFHEDMDLLQRDRAANWFAESEGAQILIATEIGSEGRNFQFAHHMILFDLPENPELLEQRIGRLDRIGQATDIHIHVPYMKKSHAEFLAKWYHSGVNSFAQVNHVGHLIRKQFHQRLVQFIHSSEVINGESFIEETAAYRQDVEVQMLTGRDRLLDLQSYNAEAAQKVLDKVQAIDNPDYIEHFLLLLCDVVGIHPEPLEHHTWLLMPGHTLVDLFPIPQKGLTFTLNRRKALRHEDIEYLTWDHPFMTAAFDFVLGSENGNSSVLHYENATARACYLRGVFNVKAVGRSEWQLPHYLAHEPIEIVLDHQGKEAATRLKKQTSHLTPLNLKDQGLLQLSQLQDVLIPTLLKKMEEQVAGLEAPIIATSLRRLEEQLSPRLNRLSELKQVNPNVRDEEIDQLRIRLEHSREALCGAKLELDSIQLIWLGPLPKGS